MPILGCTLTIEWRLKHSSLDVNPVGDQNISIHMQGGLQQVKARCLLNAELGLVRLETESAQGTGTTVHLRALFGFISTGTTEVSAPPAGV